jgi:hypothetical protein
MADIIELLKKEAGRIGPEIHRKALHTNLWNALIKQDKFPEEMGSTLSVLTYERSLPRHDPAGGTSYSVPGLLWQSVTNTGLGGAAPPYGQSTEESITPANKAAVIEFRTSTESYSLKRAFVESPRFDVEDLRTSVHRADQVNKLMAILTENTIYSWMERYRDEYLRLCKYAVILDASVDYSALNDNVGDPFSRDLTGTTGTVTNANAALCVHLNQGHLDRIHTRMLLSGAGIGAYGMEAGRPVFSVILSAEASEIVLSAAAIRENFFQSSRVDELLQPFGVQRSYRGWYHLIDDLAPRYSAGVTYITRINPYVRDAGTGIWDLNPLYETATYECAVVFHNGVYTSLMPAPNVSAGKFKFDPVNFKGDFRFVNIPSENLNPDGTNGYFRGILASASKPERREFGYALLFKRTLLG